MAKIGWEPPESFVIEKPQRRIWKIWFFSLFLIFYSLVLGAGYFIFWTPFLKVREISLPADSDKAVLIKNFIVAHFKKTDYFSWILNQDNILFWNPNNLNSFQKPAFIKDLAIKRDLIHRRIILKFSERQPFGVWCSLGADCLWFDDEGVLFAEAPLVEGFLIPKVVDSNPRPAFLGAELLDLFEIFNRSPLLKAGDILIKDKIFQELEVKTSAGFSIYINLKSPPKNLNNIISELSQKIKLSDLKYIDLRVPGRLYYQ